MNYIPTNWVDGETPVNAENMNKLEKAVLDNNAAITEINTARANGEFKGDPGYTPQRGKDYWTESDKTEITEAVTKAVVTEEMIQQVIDALSTPVFGTVDENNNIILSGKLANGTYTVKYENEDGSQTVIGTITSETPELYTNQIAISTDEAGSIYNGTGYMAERRFNSSGVVATLATSGATNPIFVTGFIPVKAGDVIRLKNCFIDTTNVENNTVYGQNGWSIQNVFYNSGKEQIGLQVWTETATGGAFTSAAPDSNGYVTEFTVTHSSAGYMRLCLAPTGDPADAILTVNQEIV